MHDPYTLAFRVPLPWFRRFGSMKIWATFAEIWHVDPETDGTDNSCGWSVPRLTDIQLSNLRHSAWCEGENSVPWFLRDADKQPISIADAELKLRALLIHTSQCIRSPVSFEWATEKASDLLHNPIDNCRSSLAFLPGWHSNFSEDIPEQRTRHMLDVYIMCARQILRHNRPWYKHPRWHFWHWQVKFPWASQFKRKRVNT